MRIQRGTNSKSEYRNTKQIQISNAQMSQKMTYRLAYAGLCFEHSNLSHLILFRI